MHTAADFTAQVARRVSQVDPCVRPARALVQECFVAQAAHEFLVHFNYLNLRSTFATPICSVIGLQTLHGDSTNMQHSSAWKSAPGFTNKSHIYIIVLLM